MVFDERTCRRLGETDDDAPHLPFRIIKVSQKQNLTEQAPFHADSGEWTFLECETLKVPAVVFTVGVMTKEGAGGTLSAWGRAMLVVRDQGTGTKLLDLLAKSFGGKIPAPVKRPFVPTPLVVNTAVLGENLTREQMGGFNPRPEGWTPTKWYLPQQHGFVRVEYQVVQ